MPKSFLIARFEEEMPSKSDTTSNVVNRTSTVVHEDDDEEEDLTRRASANEGWKSCDNSRNLWLDTLDDDCLSSDEDQNDSSNYSERNESNSKPAKEVCSRSHGMTTSELGQVVRADHDYIDLLVNVKDEEDSTDDHETELDSNRTELDRVRLDHSDFDDEDDTDLDEEMNNPSKVAVEIKEEIIDDDEEELENVEYEEEEDKVENNSKEMFDSLATLAEVSLATAGKLEADQSLKRKIDQARAKITSKTSKNYSNSKSHPAVTTKTILPITPEMSSKRTMQITLPENTTHIVICTAGGSATQSVDTKREVIKTVVKAGNNNQGRKRSSNRESKHEYECGECGKTYSTSSNLARHKQTHRSLTDKKAKKCPICTKIYVSMPAYAMHMRTHNQNCKCHVCEKTFSRPWLLQGHLRTHTGERPYRCGLCPKAFADKSNLRAHTQTHSNSKPFECRSCGKNFALKSYLYKHEEASCNVMK